MKFNAAAALIFLLFSLAIAAGMGEAKPAAVGKRVGAVESVEMAVQNDEDSKLLVKRRKHHHDHDTTVVVEEEDEDEEDGAATLAISYAALFAAVGVAAFAN